MHYAACHNLLLPRYLCMALAWLSKTICSCTMRTVEFFSFQHWSMVAVASSHFAEMINVYQHFAVSVIGGWELEIIQKQKIVFPA